MDSSKIVDGSVSTVDLAVGAVTTSKLANCSAQGQILKYYTSDPDGSGPLTVGWNCDSDNGLISETDGVIGNEVLNATTSGGLVRSGTGTSIDPYTLGIASGGITANMIGDGSITSSKLAANSVDSSKIVDGSIVNADLAVNSINSSNIVDGAVSLADLNSNSVDSSKIVDGSVSAADLVAGAITPSKLANCYAQGQILKYYVTDPDGIGVLTAGWNCDVDNGLGAEADGVIGNEVLNSTDSTLVRSGLGTTLNPYTLDISTGGVTSTELADGGIALVDLGSNSVDSSKIVDGSITASDIASGSITNNSLTNSSVTVVSGAGLVNGGSVSLGGTTTLNIGAGNGIAVNADDVSVKLAASADALSNTTSSGSGIEVLASGVTLLQGCNDGQVLRWNETSDVWACNSSVGTVSTIDSVTKSANGASVSNNNIVLQTADSTNPGLVSTTTQTFAGSKTFSGNVTNSSNTNLNTVDGADLTSCNATSSKVQYDSTAKQVTCGTDSSGNVITERKVNDESVALSLALQNDDISLSVAPNEKWAFNGYLNMTSGANIKAQMTLPSAGSICQAQISETSTGAKSSVNTCNTSVTPSQSLNTNSGGSVLQFYGTFSIGSTGGTVNFQWSQAAALASATTLKAGSYMTFTKITGADLAEVYYAHDDTISAGNLVSLSGQGVSQIEKSEISKRENIIGIVSTKPGQVLAQDDGQGKPVPVALTGRVPAKVTDENGKLKAGDEITSSATKPGFGMKATTSGRVIGKALSDATPDGMVTVFVEPGYWQAPLNFDLSSVFSGTSDTAKAIKMNTGDNFVDTSSEVKQAVIKNLTDTKQSSGLDQNLVDQIQQGFKTQQDQIGDLSKEIADLKSSDSDILKQIANKVDHGDDATAATEKVAGIRLADNSGFQYIKNLDAIKSGNDVKLSQNGKAVDYNTVISYLVQTIQDQQTQLDSLSKDGQSSNTDNTGLSLDLKSFKDSFLGQIAEIKVRLDVIEKADNVQDKKLNKLEQDNQDLKAKLEKIEKALNK